MDIETLTIRFNRGPNHGHVARLSVPAGRVPASIEVTGPTGEIGWYDESGLGGGVYTWRAPLAPDTDHA